MNNFNTITKTIAFIAVLAITGCSSESGDNSNTSNNNTLPAATITPTSLNQAAYAGGNIYNYGHNSIPNIQLSGAPADTDYTRWSMLHDGSVYRLYFFKQGTNDTLYQFGFNMSTLKYEFGYNSIDVLKITNIPSDADTSSIAMLHDGSTYRLYMRSASSETTLYQFGYNSAAQEYQFGFNSIDVLFITMAPIDADHSRWGMLHDGSKYRLYIGKAGEPDTMYQFAYNISSGDYEWGFSSIPELQVTNMPDSSIKTDFSMLHDGNDYRFYYQSNL